MSSAIHKTTWAAALAAAAAYAAALIRCSPAGLQDFPNHMARAAVIADLLFHHGARFGQVFEFHFAAVPYVLGDVLLAQLIEIFGTRTAAALWIALVFLSLPCGLVLLARSRGVAARDVPFVFLLGLYLASNTCFFRGFAAFCLGTSFTLAVLALEHRVREPGSLARWAGYVAMLVLGYLVHLSVLIFAATATAVSSLCHAVGGRPVPSARRRLRTEAELYLPIAALLVWHFVHTRVPFHSPAAAAWHWSAPATKLLHLIWPFIRFDRRTDTWILGMALGCLLSQLLLRRLRSRDAGCSPAAAEGEPRATTVSPRGEMLAQSGAFLVLYAVLPSAMGVYSWVDVRALLPASIFLLIACVAPGNPSARSAGSVRLGRHAPEIVGAVAAAACAAVNLACLNGHLRRFDAWLGHYRDAVAAVPVGAWVFPVYTNLYDHPVKSTLHATAYTLIDRDAPNPYLFSRDLGDAMQYFGYRRRPYAPDESWYVEPAGGDEIDWDRIARSYRYLLVMEPFDAARLPIPTAPVFENSTAALLEIEPRGTQAGSQRSSKVPWTRLNESKDLRPENTAQTDLPSAEIHFDGMRRLKKSPVVSALRPPQSS
jgi:hypothetical protein